MDYEPIECKCGGDKEEDKLLGSSTPFATTFKLNIPGFFFSIASAFQDAIDLYFIKGGFGTDGVTIVSIASIIRQLVVGYSYFHMQGTCSKFSEMIATKSYREACKLYVEMIRMSIILGVFATICLTFSVPYILPLMGIPENLVASARNYLMPIACIPFFSLNLTISASIVLACGRANWYSFINISALVISLGADPLFIYVFKAPIDFMGIAFILGPVSLSILLLILFSMNRFCISPNWKEIITKPSSQFWNLIYLSIPSTLSITLSSITPVVFSIFLKKSSEEIGYSTEICTVYSTTMKVYSMLIIAIQGGTSGIAPSVSYALHKGESKRLYRLFEFGHLIPMFTVFVISPIMIINPEIIIKIWIKDENMLSFVNKISPIPFYTSFIEPFVQIVAPLVIVFGHYGLATIAPIVKASSLMIASVVMTKVVKTNSILVLYSLTIQDSLNFIASVFVMIYVLHEYKSSFYALSPSTSQQEI
ncbi:hypothetical protein TVAG_473160 [Trichomonas vaginalis G3]|uniref:MatE family protein n=1 Tax=Trichomonas vaginalis (strain ATCC PRA-98 / G3) TaxID=412133 RepID=A2ERW2_TRIV3|nr:multidrug resistance protein YPNP-related family [Trichomonas vaginalis G3]EAY04629.1 hypothetical protein TVAG_473160 [Trichomonas vaginalis G3]KAI5539608.1 multidrug resistance protein YPNP-related family [Trichomonas vaginalis G3]|eukprot:XP_001316852.1 hypothetical protein [Trichomonas vaginalis G3]